MLVGVLFDSGSPFDRSKKRRFSMTESVKTFGRGERHDVFSPLPKLWALPTAEVGAMGAVVSSRHLRNG